MVFIDKDYFFDDRLGITFTDGNRHFEQRCCERDFCDLFEWPQDLYIEILDCKSATLYGLAKEGRKKK